ncbi:MAG: hypothetical protein M1451_03000, partial [Acidobacteria bacterium]|nr:hypothetical protein [Acidobacteriota bacterium]
KPARSRSSGMVMEASLKTKKGRLESLPKRKKARQKPGLSLSLYIFSIAYCGGSLFASRKFISPVFSQA